MRQREGAYAKAIRQKEGYRPSKKGRDFSYPEPAPFNFLSGFPSENPKEEKLKEKCKYAKTCKWYGSYELCGYGGETERHICGHYKARRDAEKEQERVKERVRRPEEKERRKKEIEGLKKIKINDLRIEDNNTRIMTTGIIKEIERKDPKVWLEIFKCNKCGKKVKIFGGKEPKTVCSCKGTLQLDSSKEELTSPMDYTNLKLLEDGPSIFKGDIGLKSILIGRSLNTPLAIEFLTNLSQSVYKEVKEEKNEIIIIGKLVLANPTAQKPKWVLYVYGMWKSKEDYINWENGFIIEEDLLEDIRRLA